MPDDLIFYTNPMSRGRIIRWMLEEVGATYEVETIAYADIKSDAYLAVNPMGKVPALRRGAEVITECAAICCWLADAFPQAGMAPAPHERAAYYRWLFFAAGPLEQAVTNRNCGFELTEDQRRSSGFGSFEAVERTLAAHLANLGDGWAAGPAFSAADVYLGAHMIWGTRFGTIPKRLEFETYAGRCMDRPAYRRATELDDALAAETAG